MTAHPNCHIVRRGGRQAWHAGVRLAVGKFDSHFFTVGQEHVVAFAVAEEQIRRFHRACVAQDWDRACKGQLLDEHVERCEHDQETGTDHQHGDRV